MGKKLLIDLEKLREFKNIPVEGIFKRDKYAASFKTIRELATFQFTCRKCENAPCLEACPVEALEKADNDIVRRSMFLCVRCKSCIFACPFGTMMDNLFEVKTSGRAFIRLTDEKDLQRFADSFPENIVRLVDCEENPAENLFSLTDDILIKELAWH